MKIFLFLLSLLTLLMAATTSHGQGTLIFNTRVPLDNVNLRVVGCDSAPATSPQYAAQLYAGPEGAPAASLGPIGAPVQFRSGNAAGWIDAGIVTVPGVPGGARATLQLRVWDTQTGTTYQEARFRSESSTWTTAPLGDPTATPPTLPPGLGAGTSGSFSVYCCPEPSTVALGALGLIALFLHRRR